MSTAMKPTMRAKLVRSSTLFAGIELPASPLVWLATTKRRNCRGQERSRTANSRTSPRATPGTGKSLGYSLERFKTEKCDVAWGVQWQSPDVDRRPSSSSAGCPSRSTTAAPVVIPDRVFSHFSPFAQGPASVRCLLTEPTPPQARDGTPLRFDLAGDGLGAPNFRSGLHSGAGDLSMRSYHRVARPCRAPNDA